jgi:hypothetical protein
MKATNINSFGGKSGKNNKEKNTGKREGDKFFRGIHQDKETFLP